MMGPCLNHAWFTWELFIHEPIYLKNLCEAGLFQPISSLVKMARESINPERLQYGIP